MVTKKRKFDIFIFFSILKNQEILIKKIFILILINSLEIYIFIEQIQYL